MQMSRIFKIPHFNRWMRKSGLTDQHLEQAVQEMEKGLIEADLGGGIVKKRLAIAGRGKSGGVRTLVATNKKERWIFLFGFQKNERSNVRMNELEALKCLAADLLRLSNSDLDLAKTNKQLLEIKYEK